MSDKKSTLKAFMASVVISLIFTVVYTSYELYSNRQRSDEWTAIQFVLEDVQDAIRSRKSIPKSWRDVDEALSRASSADLLTARQFVEFDFENACKPGSRFVVSKPAVGWMDANVRIARIEWLGAEIAKEIEPLCSQRAPDLP